MVLGKTGWLGPSPPLSSCSVGLHPTAQVGLIGTNEDCYLVKTDHPPKGSIVTCDWLITSYHPDRSAVALTSSFSVITPPFLESTSAGRWHLPGRESLSPLINFQRRGDLQIKILSSPGGLVLCKQVIMRTQKRRLAADTLLCSLPHFTVPRVTGLKTDTAARRRAGRQKGSHLCYANRRRWAGLVFHPWQSRVSDFPYLSLLLLPTTQGFLNLGEHQNNLEGLWEPRLLGPSSGDGDTAGPGITLWKPLPYLSVLLGLGSPDQNCLEYWLKQAFALVRI